VAVDAGFFPPERYAVVWPIVGALLVVAVVAWLGFVWWRTRPVSGAAPVLEPVPVVAARSAASLGRAKRESRAQIDRIVADVEAGRLDVRVGHQQVSRVVRDFVDQHAGTDSLTMTLSDLGSADPRLGPVAEVIQRLYPGEFGPDPRLELRPVADAAKAVIDGWH